MNKAEKIKNFDPNGIGEKGNNIYGLPFTTDEAEVVVIPVPWEVTVSYSAGTAKGPTAVFEASYQVDLYDPYIQEAWKLGIAMEAIDKKLQSKSNLLRKKSEKYIDMLSVGKTWETNKAMKAIRDEVNKECVKMNMWVKEKVLGYLNKNKIVALLGGDHSTPLGMMQALADKHDSFAVLQIDAHADLRDAYEGFEFSHASIMYNALKIKQVSKLVQVGIRDYCEAETNVVKNSNGRVNCFYDRDIKHKQYNGTSWSEICDSIVAALSEKIYLSFDIDGLDPKLCPNTGTPVAGGFEAEQVLFLIQKVVESGKKIIAFDINEITPGKPAGRSGNAGRDEWDANVGARLLYRITNMVARSNGKC